MRTTLNFDDDVIAELEARARAQHRSMSRVANDLIRAGLKVAREDESPAAYEPPTFDTGRPLVDVTDVATALEIIDRDG